MATNFFIFLKIKGFKFLLFIQVNWLGCLLYFKGSARNRLSRFGTGQNERGIDQPAFCLDECPKKKSYNQKNLVNQRGAFNKRD